MEDSIIVVQPVEAAEKPKATAYKRFTKEEDDLIRDLVEFQKVSPWTEVAKHLPGRTAAQCRDRYNGYLCQPILKKPWTPEEDELIIAKYKEFGPRWVMISQFLPGRSGTNIKNRWHKALVKYHGIEHNEIKQERRSKNIKWEKQEPKIVVISSDSMPTVHTKVELPE